MFGRKRTTHEQLADEAAASHPPREGAKNRPTPKRRDQEAARRQPLVVTDRKAARQADALKRREQRARMQEAMVTGDDRYLPPRDKGPVKRYIRDYVDAGRRVGEFLLPVMLLVLALTFLAPQLPVLYTVVFFLTYGLIGVTVLDSWLMWRRLRARLVERFGAGQVPRGSAMYAVMRAFQMRRTRMPRPAVKRGEYPA